MSPKQNVKQIVKQKNCKEKYITLRFCINLHDSKQCLNVDEFCLTHLEEVSGCLCCWLQWQPQHTCVWACLLFYIMFGKWICRETLPPQGRRPYYMQMPLLQCVLAGLELGKIHLIIFMRVCRSSPKRCFDSWWPSCSTDILPKMKACWSPEEKKILKRAETAEFERMKQKY